MLTVDRATHSCKFEGKQGDDHEPVEGPYCTVKIAGSPTDIPWYMIPFDKGGNCTAPQSRADLIADVQQNGYTDIFIFSHGWNNDWNDAVTSYRNFLCNYILMDRHGLAHKPDFRPLLVGIYWPSAILVMPWEDQPDIAAVGAGIPAPNGKETDLLAGAVAHKDVKRFRKLAAKDSLTESEALELAAILVPVYRGQDADAPVPVGQANSPTPTELVTLWTRSNALAQPEDDDGEGGVLLEGGGVAIGGAAGPGLQSAGIFKFLDPRVVVRGATVLLMKDRAGTVGAHGVSDMLRDILSADAHTRVHLMGHSFGCKVMLSAICFPPQLPRKVNSVLLLQPAVSYLAFAPKETSGTHAPGGYRVALDRVEQPILCTFSNEDSPLHNWFHWFVRRASDLAEEQIAADTPPNEFAALGGYGPGGCGADCKEIPIKQEGAPYDLVTNPPKIYALNGANAIHDHSDINNSFTWWALYNQVVS